MAIRRTATQPPERTISTISGATTFTSSLARKCRLRRDPPKRGRLTMGVAWPPPQRTTVDVVGAARRREQRVLRQDRHL